MIDENERLSRLIERLMAETETDLKGLEERLCLAEGTLELMLQYDIEPFPELIEQIHNVLGASENEIYLPSPETLMFRAPRKVFVLQAADFVKPYLEVEEMLCQIYIDRPSTDRARYVGLRAADESMGRAHIHKDDIVVVRCQAVAEEGDIVVAIVEGKTLIRRYNRKSDIIWLSAEGRVEEGPINYYDCLNYVDRKITICGRVVAVVRDF